MSENVLLKMKHVTKRFPGVVALDDVNMELNRGEVHALLGENGAGKSTLIKVLGGIYIPEEGQIEVNGKLEEIKSVPRSQELGIGIIHQEISLVPEMSVAENIYLGREEGTVFINKKENIKKVRELINFLEFDIKPTDKIKTLSIAKQQIVEIAKALSMDSKILVMDEPTAAISESDTRKLFKIINRLRKEGIGIIYISHRMDELFEITDKITVLRDGKYIATVDTKETDRQELISMMVGRELAEIYNYRNGDLDEVVLETKNLSSDYVSHMNVALRRGEILGFAGLVGAGRTEFARVLFGIDKVREGEIYIHGKKTSIRNPQAAIRQGIAMVTEDRKGTGLVLNNTVAFNSLLIVLDKFIKGCFVNQKKADSIVDNAINYLKIKTPGKDTIVGTLSGGNQQKIVLAKWLENAPDIIILDEPTRGIDVGAKMEIYELIFELAKKNVSVILISSDMAEIINLSTRVAVMKEGRITGVLDRDGLVQENILHYAMGGEENGTK